MANGTRISFNSDLQADLSFFGESHQEHSVKETGKKTANMYMMKFYI